MNARVKLQAQPLSGRRAGAPQIGAQLRTARVSRRKTLSEVALASGLTKGYLSKLERDRASASVASLIRLCGVLEIPISSLFEAPTGELVRNDGYQPINFGGEGLTEYLLTPQHEQRLQAILSEIEPGGGSGAELYALPAEVEFAFVLDGTLTVTLAEDELTLTAGDTLTFSAQTAHGFHNPDGVARTRVLWVFAPALPSPAGDPKPA